MVTHPEVTKKAHKEIDDIIGNDRLPTFDDRSDLPYINCILKETYRLDYIYVRCRKEI